MTSDDAVIGALARLADRQDLTREQSRAAVDQIMRGEATDAQIGAYLMGLRLKGETIEEVAGAAEAMRACATPVRTSRAPLLDTCGTGGDQSGTYNVSTAVAFVAAGAGVAVAKHGNRSVSSRSGSADVLEALGVRIDLDAEQMGKCLDEVGLAFLFAPRLHGAMKYAIGPRRELKLRTVFNLLGPLTNPAGASRQLLGVFSPEAGKLVAGVLRALGSEHAWVVHGRDGLDELSICSSSVVREVRGDAAIVDLEVEPESLGLARGDRSEIVGEDPATNAAWLSGLLENRIDGSSRRMVVLNAAAALHVAGHAASLAEGIALADQSIASGRAQLVLSRLRQVTHAL